MRQMIKPQLTLGVVDIAAMQLDPRSRDDMPRLLRGLQYLYLNPPIREDVLTIAAGQPASVATGRPGLSQWQILELGVLRLGLNADYDRI
jgi:IS5 family transposase